MRILINECYNIARRINVNEPLDEGYAENMKQPKENRDYSELYRAVNEPKEELRIPVILYYMEEFNIREIAQILENIRRCCTKETCKGAENTEKEDSIGGDFYMRLDELKNDFPDIPDFIHDMIQEEVEKQVNSSNITPMQKKSKFNII